MMVRKGLVCSITSSSRSFSLLSSSSSMFLSVRQKPTQSLVGRASCVALRSSSFLVSSSSSSCRLYSNAVQGPRRLYACPSFQPLLQISNHEWKPDKSGQEFFRREERYYSTSSRASFMFTTSSLEEKKELSGLPKEELMADHSWRQQNHIWTKEELEEKRKTHVYKHVPKTMTDHIAHKFMKLLYVSFNFISGYKEENPTPKSIEWRLIILESFAGVPGFLAAGFRHFYSLRNLKRDHGAIFTFLEEAENERMHLLVCLKMFDANLMTRSLVVLAQVTFTPFLWLLYTIRPQLVHRFVGYLEETAVHTYSNILDHVEKEGTHLNKAWKDLPAPEIAKSYWNLDKENGKWVDCLAHMLADEANHRDVNHTFAELPRNAPNPFVHEHMKNFDATVKRKYEESFKESKEKGLRQESSGPLHQ